MAFGTKTRGCLRVVVVDDDASTRLLFQDILQTSSRFEFAGGFSSAAEALAEIPKVKPDLTLMDLRLPDLNGVECTKRLKHLMPGLRIIIVTGTHHESWVGASLYAGAAAYLLKPIVADQLLATLRFTSIDTDKDRKIEVAEQKTEKILSLNLREKNVLQSLAMGLLYKEVSEKLGISYAAVHKCQHNIFRKLHVSNRSEAIRVWLENSGL